MKKCRICKSPIEPFISFGKMPIANGFLTREQFAQGRKRPSFFYYSVSIVPELFQLCPDKRYFL
ncbi:MAG: hypothetical protein KJ757_06015 [Planctomycetes bacterium]|nr:hypothetical protein [Planctomycetota bacterium]MBU1517591.1 hypothetical protein [Planctomycetota bacterium]MBU2457045.1 hypothetical protein [Planctomycetota bacterium]MBU2597094.1 hypothetical protein [Planctomycetota bacterium]